MEKCRVFGGGRALNIGVVAHAVLAGKREVLEHLAPTGPVYQAGTLSGNPLSVASGITTLKLADDALYRTLDTRSEQLQAALTQSLTDAGVDHSIQTAGNLFSVAFGTGEHGVRNYAEIKGSATADTAMERIIEALPGAARAAAKA